ncbi:YibE/F family protein [Georgenia sp. Z1344]|uniref:YibE/F family protein n=1 Tax=Georgenia sp. Z1344 TaxID=3416706 RepID=UPI003CF7BCCF
MSHSHSTDPPELPAGRVRRVRTLLSALVLPLLVATVVGLVALWPSGDSPMGSIPLTGDGTEVVTGTVLAPPASPEAAEFRVEVTGGGHDGYEATVASPHPSVAEEIDAGDDVLLLYMPQNIGTGTLYSFWDFDREAPVGWLAVLYLAAVLAVARWRGLAAVLGLLASLGVVAVFMLPALMAGSSPILVALVGSSAMMFIAVYLAHGISIRTTTALLGTYVGLAITVVLAVWATGAANLTGSSEDAIMLHQQFAGLTLSDLLLCGIVVAGLGALNDVTITQASAVWELAAASPGAPRRRLFVQGMRIGRDHIASTVYTLAFAYVGTALPLIMLASLVERPVVDTLMAGEIAEEVVRTLVSSIGLVLAIPVTTGIAALLARSGGDPSAAPRHDT